MRRPRRKSPGSALPWAGREADAADLADRRASGPTFHKLVAKEREHPPVDENGPRIAVPVDARCLAIVVNDAFRLCQELAQRLEMLLSPFDENDRRRIFEQLPERFPCRT